MSLDTFEEYFKTYFTEARADILVKNVKLKQGFISRVKNVKTELIDAAGQNFFVKVDPIISDEDIENFIIFASKNRVNVSSPTTIRGITVTHA